MDLFECEFTQRTVELRGRSRRPKPSVFSKVFGAADEMCYKQPLVLHSCFFECFFIYVFFTFIKDSLYRNETDEPPPRLNKEQTPESSAFF